MPAPDYGRAPGPRAAPPDQHRPKFAELPRRAPSLAAGLLFGTTGPACGGEELLRRGARAHFIPVVGQRGDSRRFIKFFD